MPCFRFINRFPCHVRRLLAAIRINVTLSLAAATCFSICSLRGGVFSKRRTGDFAQVTGFPLCFDSFARRSRSYCDVDRRFLCNFISFRKKEKAGDWV